MRVLFLVIVFAWQISSAQAASFADQQVARWWSALSSDEQVAIQTELILTGHYGAMVDGEFGPATLRALKGFQRDSGANPTGILSRATRQALDDAATERFVNLGMELVEDRKTGFSAFLPLKLLQAAPVEDGVATTYRTADDGLIFTMLGTPAEGMQLADVAEYFQRPVAGRTVTYTTVNDENFVITGSEAGGRFYTLMKVKGGRLVGYSVRWGESYDEIGQMLAVLSASYATPLEDLEAPSPSSEPAAPTTPADEDLITFKAYTDEGERVGAFLLPRTSSRVIVLDGEIGPGTPLDFIRALKKRPDATVISLNSPGGRVSAALLVAHEVSQRQLNTLVPRGYGCYSACAYIFLAGRSRTASGELGVHQVYGDQADASSAQYVLSDVLDALKDFGVDQEVISVMLRTPPEEVYVFSPREISALGIDR